MTYMTLQGAWCTNVCVIHEFINIVRKHYLTKGRKYLFTGELNVYQILPWERDEQEHH